MSQETQTGALYQTGGTGVEGWDEKGDGRQFQKEEDICIPMADSCWCLTENNKIL